MLNTKEVSMTKQEYNDSLKRYYKAMAWFESKPSEEQIEKFWVHFELLLEDLRTGCLELNAKGDEVMGGFDVR